MQMHCLFSRCGLNRIHSLLVSRTYGLPVGVFFLIVGSLASDISTSRCGNWQLDHDSENNLDTSVVLWEKNNCPLIDCALVCELDSSCRSFFHHPSTENCLGSQSHKRRLHDGQAEQTGWKYFTRPQQCDGDYVFNQTLGLCYKYHKENKTFSNAMVACETEGAKLMIIRNEAELQHFTNVTTGSNNVWIGLTAVDVNRVWKWWNGQAASYIPWSPGQPNNYSGNQFCAGLYQLGFNDRDCYDALFFVCQRYI